MMRSRDFYHGLVLGLGIMYVLDLSTHASPARAPRLRGEIGDRRRAAAASPEWATGLRLAAGIMGAAALAFGAIQVAARYRANRLVELEAEMPEYAMLR